MAKVLISIPDDLLARVDREAARRSTSRSVLLQDAVRRELGWPDADAVDAAVGRGRAALRSAGSFDSGELIRSDRNDRDARDRRR